MLDTNFNVDVDSQSFEPPRENNHGATETSAQVLLGYDSLQYQHNNTIHMTGQKTPPSGEDYIFVQNDGESALASQCAKP